MGIYWPEKWHIDWGEEILRYHNINERLYANSLKPYK